MTTEASWKVSVAQIIGVRTPRDLEIREYISIVNCKNCLTRLIDGLRALSVEVWIVLLIKGNELSRQFVGCFLGGGVVCLQHFNAFLLDVRQGDGNITKRESFVHGAIWQIEGVRRAIVAVYALHIVSWESLQRIWR